MTKQTIIISAYPKSGSTFLTRLLADTLNCPSAGSHPSQDRREIASEGWDRPGDYIVRKGHYKIIPNSGSINEFIPIAHTIIPENHTNERIIFLIRDPRDIIVSACHHWKSRNREEIINLVCRGGLANLPAWDEYLRQWQQIKNVKTITYEALLFDTLHCVEKATDGLTYDKFRLKPAIERQSFDNRKEQIGRDGDSLYLGKQYNLQFMRKGIVGDYKNFLTKQEQDTIWKSLGKMMERMGYTQ